MAGDRPRAAPAWRRRQRVIDARRLQRSFGDGFVAEAVDDLLEAWMRQADAMLEDDSWWRR